MSKKKDNKHGVVYSTNPDFEYQDETGQEQETLPPAEQKLTVMLDNKGRKGKDMTAIEGFVGTEDGLKQLSKELKNYCGTGGTVKDGAVLIQGDLRGKITEYLAKEGYKVKRR